jgi:DNA integrity scanning protein DisA with diadenylate cyclase activity
VSDKTDNFIRWILSLGPKRKGTSIIVSRKSLVKILEEFAVTYFRIQYSESDFLANDEDQKFDFNLLDHFTLIDGGIVLNENLVPIYIGTIVPNRRGSISEGLGARHNSIMSFTSHNDCLGIVISEDGPITIYEQGKQLLKI